MLRHLDQAISRLPRLAVFVAGLASVAGLGVMDYLTEHIIALDILYFAPLAVVTWYCSRNLGMVTAAFATVSWSMGSFESYQLQTQGAIVLWNVAGHLAVLGIFVTILASLRRRIIVIEELANLDPLTRVANRRSFHQAAAMESRRCQRYGTAFTIVYIDIDEFKAINDTFGHAEGDELLRCVAGTLRAHTRATDTVGRIGGDEFVLLLPETDEAQARLTVEKLRTQLREATCGRKRPVTLSIGVVTFVKAPVSVEEMLNCVDEVMYTVKRATKDSVSYARWPELKSLDSVR